MTPKAHKQFPSITGC